MTGSPMVAGAFYRMSPFEVATGWPTGEDGGDPSDLSPPIAAPIEALEHLLRPALSHPPCVVAFSGGRDSSILLAVAAGLAAREGLPSPVAATLRYPGVKDALEDDWQDLVVRHLGIRDWERVTVVDEADLVGPIATSNLLRHGLVWPPAHHHTVPLWSLAGGGSLVTGDGGDEVFGDQRGTALLRLLAGRPAGAADVGEAALALAPRAARRRVYERRLRAQLTRSWLRPEAQERFARALAVDGARAPLRWEASVLRLPKMRARRLGFANQTLLASLAGVALVRPFHDPVFAAALGRCDRPWGFPDRTTAMTHLFSPLLPAPLLARSTKAAFNRVAFGRHSRAFVATWTGGGVPTDLVDVDALQRAWAADIPHALSFALLQSAWLAERAPAAGSVSARTLAVPARSGTAPG